MVEDEIPAYDPVDAHAPTADHALGEHARQAGALRQPAVEPERRGRRRLPGWTSRVLERRWYPSVIGKHLLKRDADQARLGDTALGRGSPQACS
jgi:hypothetical protein